MMFHINVKTLWAQLLMFSILVILNRLNVKPQAHFTFYSKLLNADTQSYVYSHVNQALARHGCPQKDSVRCVSTLCPPYRGGRCEICVCSGVEGGGYQGDVKWNDRETVCSHKIWAGQQPLNLRKYPIYKSLQQRRNEASFHSFSFVSFQFSFPPFFLLLFIIFQETTRK